MKIIEINKEQGQYILHSLAQRQEIKLLGAWRLGWAGQGAADHTPAVLSNNSDTSSRRDEKLHGSIPPRSPGPIGPIHASHLNLKGKRERPKMTYHTKTKNIFETFLSCMLMFNALCSSLIPFEDFGKEFPKINIQILKY